jgi:hypothetical protein
MVMDRKASIRGWQGTARLENREIGRWLEPRKISGWNHPFSGCSCGVAAESRASPALCFSAMGVGASLNLQRAGLR